MKRVFPRLSFKNPVDLCPAPGADRLFLAEQAGQVYSFRNDAAVQTPELFVNLADVNPGVTALYGIGFHPGFQTNHFVYICYVLKDGLPDGSRVSRFKVAGTDSPRVDPASEQIVITWLSGGHNGGCVKFGRDGYLYISTGDGAGPDPPDPLQTGQAVGDLLSSILRIDVDHAEGAKAYRVPPDNPFVGRKDARPEVWAYGLRNPWRMSFDRESGALWVADVGWELWEMVYRVERGGNYGWSIVEGPQSVHPDWKRGPSPILPPLKSHPHSEAASITGGFVYHGRRLNALAGAYIYGDWVTGKIWALRSDGGTLKSVEELVDTTLQIVCFAEENTGELLIVDYGGGIYQLEPNSAPSHQEPFPQRLSETGLFSSPADHQLAPGVLRFEINAAMWADGAKAERFIGLPGLSRIQTGPVNNWLNQGKNDWRYPTNAVLAKTLSLELESGRPESARRVETQVLHFDGVDWHAYSYRWNEAQTNAALVDATGGEATFDVKDPAAPGGHREQPWRFHSRAECLRCHNPWVNVALAFTGPQLNCSLTYRAEAAKTQPPTGQPSPHQVNQLRHLSKMGCFDQPLDERARPRLTNPYDVAAEDMAERARSWLHVNCSHCHREGAGGSVVSHFDYESSLTEMKAVGRPASQGDFGLTNAHVITPGEPASSVLLYRIATTGQGHMPLIGSRQVDVRAVQLIHDWIRTLPGDGSEVRRSGEGQREEAYLEALSRVLNPTSSQATVSAALDHLFAAPNGALALVSALSRTGRPCPPEATRKAAQDPRFQIRELFERFLPDELRPRKLGLNATPQQILATSGNAERGRLVFFREGVQCSQCHRIQGQGRDFGPDLSRIGSKHSRAQLVEEILNPSKTIDPAFVTYDIETADGRSYSGFVLKRTNSEISVKDADLTVIHIPGAQIKRIEPRQLSAMPEGLLQSMTQQEASDLIEFLSSLHNPSP